MNPTISGITYQPNWQQQALDQGVDVNNPMFSQFHEMDKASAGTGSTGMTGFNQPTIDLPSIYKSLYDTSGIAGTQQKLSEAEKAFNDNTSKINDNPFLSESNRVGRISKLTTDYTNSTANLKNDVATKKADIDMQLQLQSKQFDINSQQAQQAQQQFNSLLSSGSLDNASPADIANITRATGMSSTMIQSAIDESKAKNIKTQTIQFNDGQNTGFAIIDQNGNIINKQVIASAPPTKYNTPQSSSTTKTSTQTKVNEQTEVQHLIALYKNVTPSNPSFAQAHQLRQQFSPQDFLSNLLLVYPTQTAYIKANFKV